MPRNKFDLSQLPPLPDLAFERNLWARGIRHAAGVDEAGRGALAGPVFAAAVILPDSRSILKQLDGVNDSKQLTHPERDRLRNIIMSCAVSYGIGFADSQEIDTIGIVPATRLAVRRALLELDPLPDHLLVDHLDLPQVPIPQTSLVKGDARSLSIAAASILAKTARDDRMQQLDLQYPGYWFSNNKGYGTPEHLQAIRQIGPCTEHRRSFAPIRSDSPLVDNK